MDHIGNMIDKYCEIYNGAIRAGLTEEQAHQYTAKWFEAGFAYLRSKEAA